jgi:hypothetical protein
MLFSFSGVLEYADLVKSNDQVEFLETYEIPGALAEIYRSAGVYTIEVDLDNGVVVTLHGYEIDELKIIANIISSNWD